MKKIPPSVAARSSCCSGEAAGEPSLRRVPDGADARRPCEGQLSVEPEARSGQLQRQVLQCRTQAARGAGAGRQDGKLAMIESPSGLPRGEWLKEVMKKPEGLTAIVLVQTEMFCVLLRTLEARNPGFAEALLATLDTFPGPPVPREGDEIAARVEEVRDAFERLIAFVGGVTR